MCVAFLYFAFERDYDGLRLKNPCFFMNENKLYRHNNAMYVKIKIEKRMMVLWYSNSKKEQERMSMKNNIT